MPKLGQRLTMCAVWGKTCFAELDPTELDTVAVGPEDTAATAVSQHLRKKAHPHCLACAEQGIFQVAYELLRLSLKVGCAVGSLAVVGLKFTDVRTQSLLCVRVAPRSTLDSLINNVDTTVHTENGCLQKNNYYYNTRSSIS